MNNNIFDIEAMCDGAVSKRIKLLMLCACTTVLKTHTMMDVYRFTLRQAVSKVELIEATSIALLLGSSHLLQRYKTVLFHAVKERHEETVAEDDPNVFFSNNNSEVDSRFSEFYNAVYRDGEISPKDKQLIALSVSFALMCTTCVDSHTTKAANLGATDGEIQEAKEVGMLALEAGRGFITCTPGK